MLQLPPLHAGIRTLTNFESDRAGRSPYTIDNCVTCGGKKSFMGLDDAKPRNLVEFECSCIDQWFMYRYFTYCGIPLGYQRLGILDATGVGPVEMRVFQTYINNAEASLRTGRGLFMYGAPGTGKTLLSALLLKYLVAMHSASGHFISFTGLLEGVAGVKGGMDKDHRNWLLNRLHGADVLVIDDPGRENKAAGEFAISALNECLRHRIAACKPTFITTNETADTFGRRYTEYTTSLLTERSTMVPFVGDDFRREVNPRSKEELYENIIRPIVVL